MPMRVVNDLEVVEIHVHQRQRAGIATVTVQLLPQAVGERAGVQDVCERILYDQARHLRFSTSQGLEARHGEAQDGEIRQPRSEERRVGKECRSRWSTWS